MKKSLHFLPALIFATLILILGFYTELYFHVSGKKTLNPGKINQPFHLIHDLSFSQIKITHKSDFYDLYLKNGVWSYRFDDSDIMLEARGDMVRKLINTLSSIKITRELHNDRATKSNYLLDTPWLRVHLLTVDNESLSLSFGLNNPISNTSYMMYDNGIYEIDSLPQYLSLFTQNDLLSRNPFQGTYNGMKSYSLKKQDKVITSYAFQNNSWVNTQGSSQPAKEIEDFIMALTQKQSLIVIDKPEPSVKESLAKALANPVYQIEYSDRKNTIHKLLLAGPLSQIPSSQGSLNNVYALKREGTDFTWIIAKDFFQFLTKKK